MHVHAKPPMPEQAMAPRPQKPASVAPLAALKVERISDTLSRDGRGGRRNGQGSQNPRGGQAADESGPTYGATIAFASLLASVDVAALDDGAAPAFVTTAPRAVGSVLDELISGALSGG